MSAVLGGAILLHAELHEWIQHLPSGPLIAIFFRTVPMPDGSVEIRRPPSETRPALTSAIAAKPSTPSLYRLRAHEDEMALDFAAAEADWRKFAQLSSNHVQGFLQLADYYHRREQASKEVAALQNVASAKTDPLNELKEQPPWKAVERILHVVDDENLPPSLADSALTNWLALHPDDVNAYHRAVSFYSEHGEFDHADTAIAAYAKHFPEDRNYAVQARVEVEAERGSVDKGLAVYDSAFEPLWPAELTTAWFTSLEHEARLRDFVGAARAKLAADPTDLNASARLFAYFQYTHNAVEARRTMLSLQIAKGTKHEAWQANELFVLGRLFERLPDINEAARCYYGMYSLPGVADGDAEQALASLTNLLLTQSGERIAFGSGDLSFYQDIGIADASPGFLNGILSLLLNSSSPSREFAAENEKSAVYFRRSSGARLLGLLSQRFPKSERLPVLRAALVDAYATYSDHDAVIRSGREYLTEFPAGSQRVEVALRVVDSLAALHRESEEFALYDDILKELGAQARGVPLGNKAVPSAAPRGGLITLPFARSRNGFRLSVPAISPLQNLQDVDTSSENPGEPPRDGARSPDYRKVLDRYLARLSALKRPMDALRVYRRELDRNPGDAGLYRQFAEYLDNNRLGQQLVETYRRAITRFADRSWYDALARWYLREKRVQDFSRLTREVTGIFSGTELEGYFNRVVSPDPGGNLYLELNLYAHQRFPEDLQFVRNLLNAYSRQGTANSAAYAELLRNYWFYDDALKTQHFQNLSSSGRLYPALASLRKANPGIEAGTWTTVLASNPAAVRFDADAEAWLSHFEAAAPALRVLAEAEPGYTATTNRASSIYRSLAAYDAANTDVALGLMDFAHRSNPRDRDALATEGDILADRGEFSRARPFWNSIVRIEPGKPDSWLNAGTIFWDYYLFDDALRLLNDARKKFDSPELFAYQAGAIYEGKRDYRRAVEEYAAGGAIDDEQAEHRLLRLAERKSTAVLVDRVTASLASTSGANAKVRNLRISVLERQNRRNDLSAYLTAELRRVNTAADAGEIEEAARRFGFDDIQDEAQQKQVQLTTDPVDHMRKEIDLARFYEARKETAKARQTITALYRNHPNVLGVVRAAVDFETRQNEPAHAIEILVDASKIANADFAHQFTFEAARISTDAAQYHRARTLLEPLLKSEPYRADYLSAFADTYAKAGDDAGFERFTLETIKRLQTAPLAADEQRQRLVALRRGLIPVLTREKAFGRAVDQYIASLNIYPEDENLAREAAQYAIAHQRLDQLRDFYGKTIQQAPRDYRWPIVLARIEAAATDFPAAIANYDLAMHDRPDRADLAEARGALEERLLRFDEALKTYRKLYELTYWTPTWMRKIAELQARLGRPDEAVKSLQIAIIGDSKETADALFEIATELDQWNLVPQALGYAERGAALDPANLPAVYYRVLTRARRLAPVLARSRADLPNINLAATAVVSEYTPEDKADLEKALGTGYDRLSLAQQFGMAPLEAKILERQLETQPNENNLRALSDLQTRRGAFTELGHELEKVATLPADGVFHLQARNQAATSYAAEGDRTDAIRILDGLAAEEQLPPALQHWYLATLSRNQPERLITVASTVVDDQLRNGAVQYAIANTTPDLALRAVSARGTSEIPVWKLALTALTGVYFADGAPPIENAFIAALGSEADIGTRLQHPVDRKNQLAGNIWFYYGARFGEYLSRLHRAGSNDFLPSRLEFAPNDPQGYMELGGFYEEQGRAADAISAYRRAIQLDASASDAHDHVARVLAKTGDKAKAISEWRVAIATLERMQARGVAVPEYFWTRATEMIEDIGAGGALPDLQTDLSRWMVDYTTRNGGYRLDPLLDAAFEAASKAHQSTEWVLNIAVDSGGADAISSLLQKEHLTQAQRVDLERRELLVLERKAAAAHGDEQRNLEQRATDSRAGFVSTLLDNHDVKGAQTEWNRLSPAAQKAHPIQAIRLASATGTLSTLLQQYLDHPEGAPQFEQMQQAVAALRDEKRNDDALSLAEFSYRRELDAQNVIPANFLGLATVYLERKQASEAVRLLHRMTLVAREPFETFVPAAELLSQYEANQQAADFLRDRLRAVPWDASAALKLAKLESGETKTALLKRVVADSYAPYPVRVDAAEALAPNGAAGLSANSELAVLAKGKVSNAEAEKPYRVAARVEAAKSTSRLDLLREATAIAPDDASTRVTTIRSALHAGGDNFALSLAQAQGGSEGFPEVYRRRRYQRLTSGVSIPLFDNVTLADSEKAALAHQLSSAAQTVDDIPLAITYEQAALGYQKAYQPEPDHTRLDALQAEQDRRLDNAARQPAIGSSIEQKLVVRPRLPEKKIQ